MTKQRTDNHSTEFGLWLRNQKRDASTCSCCNQKIHVNSIEKWRSIDPIDSDLGFVTSNLDFIWTNYITGEWMLIEEKRYGASLSYSQQEIFKVIHQACADTSGYMGLHVLVFEKTSPEDGRMWLDDLEITKSELIDFLQFKPKKELIRIPVRENTK